MATAGLERFEAAAQRQADAVDVGEQHLAPDFGIGATEAAFAARHAGIGVDRIELAEMIEHLLHHGLLRGVLLHVTADRQRTLASAKLIHQSRQFVLGARGEGNAVPGLGREAGSGSAYSGGGAGDQKYRVAHGRPRQLAEASIVRRGFRNAGVIIEGWHGPGLEALILVFDIQPGLLDDAAEALWAGVFLA
jgi:hypothetical protein